MSLALSIQLLSLTTLFTCIHPQPPPNTPSPYISPHKFFADYDAMLNNFKVFVYMPNAAIAHTTSSESLFHAALQRSHFVTGDAERAHLFLVPFAASEYLSAAAISRVVGGIRRDFPYWDRTVGADHVFLSCAGLAAAGLRDRNALELKKNAIQISCFPTPADNFVPHKDITLPPAPSVHAPTRRVELAKARPVLGYFRARNGSVLAERLAGDPDFVVDFEPGDEAAYAERLSSSKFCVFEYGGSGGGAARIGDALRYGCVPAVVVAGEAPVLELPFADVLAWREMAVFVGGRGDAAAAAAEELKRALRGLAIGGDGGGGERYERMRAVGLEGSKHFVWRDGEGDSAEPYDCFGTVMYQLWLRRHSTRYVVRRRMSGSLDWTGVAS